MFNTSIITQILENTQMTTSQIPTNTQSVITQMPTSTQTTTPVVPVSTQTTTPQIPVSNITTLPNIGQTVTTPVETTTGATQGGSSTGNPGNSIGGFNFFNNLYENTGGLGFNNTQNLLPGFRGGFRGGPPGG